MRIRACGSALVWLLWFRCSKPDLACCLARRLNSKTSRAALVLNRSVPVLLGYYFTVPGGDGDCQPCPNTKYSDALDSSTCLDVSHPFMREQSLYV